MTKYYWYASNSVRPTSQMLFTDSKRNWVGYRYEAPEADKFSYNLVFLGHYSAEELIERWERK